MKTIKIRRENTDVGMPVSLDYNKIVTSGSDLCMVIDRDKALGIIVGDTIRFEKVASGGTPEATTMYKVYEEDAIIKDIVDVFDEEQESYIRYIYFGYIYIKPLYVASFQEIESSKRFKYKMYLTDEHHMVPGDFPQRPGEYKVFVRRGNEVLTLTGLALCYPNEVIEGEDILGPDGDCCPDDDTYFNYGTMERNSILITDIEGNSFTPEPGDKVLFCTNPLFYINSDGEVICYSGVTVYSYRDYLGVNVVLEQDYDAKRMFQEYQVNELFVKKIKNSVIPDFVDLEKIKYAPSFLPDGDEEKAVLATGLTFNMHFRTRFSAATTEDIPEDIARYMFDDTWHFDDDVDTWNGNGVQDGEFDLKKAEELYSDEDFVNSSNLMGYLGFTDDDIFNQKNRVKKSFLRLLFYDGDNPLTQNLLFYSTIFFDSGELYGRYLKRKAWLEEKDEFYNQEVDPVVWSPTGTTDPVSAITSQLTVNDEYDMTKSGEGFNLYLFREDAPIENVPQDIYMKVEFNHAGYGRTVPLFCWPRETAEGGGVLDKPAKLTIENYRNNLYIKVRLSFTEEKGYVYSFPDAVAAEDTSNFGRRNPIVWENDRLVFNLFEPRITPDEFN